MIYYDKFRRKGEKSVDAAGVKAIKDGEIVTVQQAAARFGIPVTTLYDWIRRGYIDKVPRYRRILVYAEQIAAAILVYTPKTKK